MDEKEYSVSEAVRLTGVPSHVLRYWEEELQVTIRRTQQGHRVYSEQNLELFRYVKKLKEKGIQLKAIRVLLEETGARDETLAGQIREIVQAGADTQEKEEELYFFTDYIDGKKRVEPTGQEKAMAETDGEMTVCEIILKEERPDNLRQFEQILKQMMEEVVAEQNEKLERAIAELIREEIEELYVQYYQAAMQEAAAAQEKAKEQSGVLKSLKKLLFKKQ